MARALRIEYPGAFYHVINRGNAGDDILKSLRDREKFLEYLQSSVERYGLKIHTYCLMTNHYHMLVETLEANLSRADPAKGCQKKYGTRCGDLSCRGAERRKRC